MFTTFHSLVVATANGTTLDTVIQCNSSVGIVMTNITNLTMSNIVIKGCNKSTPRVYGVNHQVYIAVTIKNSFDVILSWVHIYMENKDILHTYSLLGINVLGKSKFSNFSCNKIILHYHDIQTRNINNTISIDHFQQVEHINTFLTIELKVYQHDSYQLMIHLAHMIMTLQHQPKEFLHGRVINSILQVMNCQFTNHLRFPLFSIKVAINNNEYSSIKFIDCKFLSNSSYSSHALINILDLNITVVNCTFNGSSSSIISRLHMHEYDSYKNLLLIKNTQFINYNLLSLIDTENVNVIIVNSIFNGNQNILIASYRGNGSNKSTTVAIKNTQFNCDYLNNTKLDYLIKLRNVDVIIVNCSFNGGLKILDLYGYGNDIRIINCNFSGSLRALQAVGHPKNLLRVTIIIKNSQFINSVLKDHNNLLMLLYSNLILEGAVIFHTITNHSSIIEVHDRSTITIHGRVEFSNNIGRHLISFTESDSVFKSAVASIQYIKIKDPTIISMHHNQLCNYFALSTCEGTLYQFCIFQYYTNRTFEDGNFSIEYYNNQLTVSKWRCNSCYIPVTNCQWLPESAFHHMIPTEVNNRFIKYINNSDAIKVNIDQYTFCACNNQMNRDCAINNLGYLYPGETLNIFLYHKNITSAHHATEIIVKNDINIPGTWLCVVLSFAEHSQIITNNHCSKVSYSSLIFWLGNWCELFLKTKSISGDHYKRFYVRKLSCPPGFIEINKTCQCDPIIVDYGITECNN